jgi:alkylation response protein AidB-like acyl-CoA dehydrogenase
MLEQIASAEQKQKFLVAMAKAEIRSCFCMTEPAPGAGADPAQLQTVAEPSGNGYVINGRKFLITGALDAGVAIIMARTGANGEATMFITELPNPAFKIERVLDTIDSSMTGGHSVVAIENLEVVGDAVLGEVGKGFRYAQVRLAPARLTHCMRWLGSAVRAQEIAVAHANTRTAFGKTLGEHQGVSFMLADNAIDIQTARLLIQRTAWLLDQGERASAESSLAKVYCSEAVFRVADRAMQVLGGLGTTRDTVVERIFRETRSFRIYDGPSEVHRWALGRRVLKGELT